MTFPLRALTPRESQVLQLLATDASEPQIAEKLFISVNTVKAHRRRIYLVLGVHSRAEAVAKYLDMIEG